MENERVVVLRPRTVVMVSSILVGLAAALVIVWVARQVITWILIATFLAIAMDPAIRALQRRGVQRRGAAAALIYVVLLVALGALAALFIPPLAHQISQFVDAVPGYVNDLTKGRGPLGFLETKYHVVERVREATQTGGTNLAGGASAVLTVTASVATGVAGIITIAFMTFFMLLEGPDWIDRGFTLMPPEPERRWRRVGHDVYRIIGGYVSGNLLISAVAAITATVVLLVTGVRFPLALGLLVFILDLIPLAGATLAAVILALVAFTHSTTAGIVVIVYFVVYQQIENHLLQPLVYGRTVQISPLLALIAVLIGAEVAGVLGALGAIPIAASLQAVLRELRRQRMEQHAAVLPDSAAGLTAPPGPPGH
jgi:predicted PurR-regulated permease PerM